jgi:hypothetical protein
LSPSPRGTIPMRRTIPDALRKNSALCRSPGLANRIRLPGRQKARWTALAAATVDFPHCREQFKIPRRAVEASTAACRSSGKKPSRVRANRGYNRRWLLLGSPSPTLQIDRHQITHTRKLPDDPPKTELVQSPESAPTPTIQKYL